MLIQEERRFKKMINHSAHLNFYKRISLNNNRKKKKEKALVNVKDDKIHEGHNQNAIVLTKSFYKT